MALPLVQTARCGRKAPGVSGPRALSAFPGEAPKLADTRAASAAGSLTDWGFDFSYRTNVY